MTADIQAELDQLTIDINETLQAEATFREAWYAFEADGNYVESDTYRKQTITESLHLRELVKRYYVLRPQLPMTADERMLFDRMMVFHERKNKILDGIIEKIEQSKH